MPLRSHRKPPEELIDVEALKDRCFYLEDRVDELEGLLGLHTKFRFPEASNTKTTERLIGMLLATPRLSSEAAFAALYGHRPEPPVSSVLSVHMTTVRRLLAQFDIHLVTLYGFGWALSEDDRGKLRKLVK